MVSWERATTGATFLPHRSTATITPDLRGHGRSTNPSGVFRFADVARDVFALLDRLGINRVKAIGMSAGANTLLQGHAATVAN
jgi:pimeloyl-ACP methyl ester carboxylesterase